MRFAPYGLAWSRPSGRVDTPWPEIANHPDTVRVYQTNLIGLGYDVGPAGANGQYNQTTADAVRRFQIAYNALPASERRDPVSVTVNAQLTNETQDAIGARWYAERWAPTNPPMASFLDPSITLGTSNATAGASPWTVVGTVVAFVGVSLAVANYFDRRGAR